MNARKTTDDKKHQLKIANIADLKETPFLNRKDKGSKIL